MKVAVIGLDNKKAGEITLNPAVFGLEVRQDLLQRMVRWQLAKRRAGTHQTKTISMVSGTTAKPYRQKGTGRARQGSLRATQFRGGATVFGPLNREHGHKLPKKVRQLALKTALSAKQSEGKLCVVKDFAFKDAKTKQAVQAINALGWKSALCIDGQEVNEGFRRATSNIVGIDVLPQQGINVYDILRRDVLVLSESAVKYLEERLA